MIIILVLLLQIKSTFTLTLNTENVSGEDITNCVNEIENTSTAKFNLVEITCSDGNQAEYNAGSFTLLSSEYQCASGYMVDLPDTSSGCGKTKATFLSDSYKNIKNILEL